MPRCGQSVFVRKGVNAPISIEKTTFWQEKATLEKILGWLFLGGDNRTRICDLPRVRRTLYQLSYASISKETGVEKW